MLPVSVGVAGCRGSSGDQGQVWVSKGCGYSDRCSGAFAPPTHIPPPTAERAPRSGHLLLRPGAVSVGPGPAGDAGQHGGGWRGGEAPGLVGRGGRAGWEATGVAHRLLFFLSLPRPSQALNLDKWVGLALGVTCLFHLSWPQALLLGPRPAHRGWGSPPPQLSGAVEPRQASQ